MASSKGSIVSLGMSGFCSLGFAQSASLPSFPFSHFLERFLLVFCMGFPWLMSLLPASLFLVVCLHVLLFTLNLCPVILI